MWRLSSLRHACGVVAKIEALGIRTAWCRRPLLWRWLRHIAGQGRSRVGRLLLAMMMIGIEAGLRVADWRFLAEWRQIMARLKRRLIRRLTRLVRGLICVKGWLRLRLLGSMLAMRCRLVMPSGLRVRIGRVPPLWHLLRRRWRRLTVVTV